MRKLEFDNGLFYNSFLKRTSGSNKAKGFGSGLGARCTRQHRRDFAFVITLGITGAPFDANVFCFELAA